MFSAIIGVLHNFIWNVFNRRAVLNDKRRGYALKLEEVLRKMEQHGFLIYQEHQSVIHEYIKIANELETYQLLSPFFQKIVSGDSKKLFEIAEYMEVPEAQKTLALSGYRKRLKTIVVELKK